MLIYHWDQHNGMSTPNVDVAGAIEDAHTELKMTLAAAINTGEVVNFGTYANNQALTVSIEFPNGDQWTGGYACDELVLGNIIKTEQEIHVDATKLPAAPTSSAPVNPKTMNIPVDPTADYDRAMKGL
jgi:hypothetical protein